MFLPKHAGFVIVSNKHDPEPLMDILTKCGAIEPVLLEGAYVNEIQFGYDSEDVVKHVQEAGFHFNDIY